MIYIMACNNNKKKKMGCLIIKILQSKYTAVVCDIIFNRKTV